MDSDVFKWFGHMGRPSDSNCVKDGYFAKGVYNVSPNPVFGSKGRHYDYGRDKTCLRRCGSPAFPLEDATTLASILFSATTYDEFHDDDGSGYHGQGHVIIGGRCDLGNFYVSAYYHYLYF